MTELKITQADRDAAAAYYYSAGGSPKIANEIREGKKDGWFRVQAFARHRIAAEEGKAELVAALGKRAFHFTEPHLSGYRVCIGFENKDDAYGAHFAIAQALARVRGEG